MGEEDAAKEYAFRRSSNSICYIVMSKNSKFELKVDWFYTLCSNKAAATVCSFDRRQLATSSKKILYKPIGDLHSGECTGKNGTNYAEVADFGQMPIFEMCLRKCNEHEGEVSGCQYNTRSFNCWLYPRNVLAPQFEDPEYYCF